MKSPGMFRLLLTMSGLVLSGVWLADEVRADTVTLLDDYEFICEMHIEAASRTFDHDPAEWLEFEIGYWTLAIPRSIVKSASEDDLYEKPVTEEDAVDLEEILIEIRRRQEELTGGGAERTAALGARLVYLRNFAEVLPAGGGELVDVFEGDLLPEGSELEVKRNSRAELRIGERVSVGVRAGTVVELRNMKQTVQGGQTMWVVDLGIPEGGVWVEIAGLGPGETVEMDLAGCSFELASDALISVTSALATRYAFGYWRGPQELRVSAVEHIEGGGFNIRRGYMVVFGAGASGVTESRLSAGGEEEWRGWREFEPVSFELPFRPIPPPLDQMDSKDVLYSLRRTRVMESLEIRGEIKSNLIQDLALHRAAVQAFRNDVGRYPTTEEGFEALRENPGSEGWKGPYLSEEVQPLDPWEEPYRYRLLGSGDSGTPVVYSTGQNRTDEYGLGDDIH